jgi:hypothetical protein
MTITTSQVYVQVSNVLDYLANADLAVYVNAVARTDTRVSFHVHAPKGTRFLENRRHPTIDQYRIWIEQGAYSAMLFDGSLLQIDYTVEDGGIVGQRLAFVPCPYAIDLDLISGGDPVLDVLDLYAAQDPLLRSPLRLDFDPGAATAGHPAAHLTINGSDCRIACVGPMHVLRFVSFVFEQFYPEYWKVHQPFFAAGRSKFLGEPSITTDERDGLHVAWNVWGGGASPLTVLDDVPA